MFLNSHSLVAIVIIVSLCGGAVAATKDRNFAVVFCADVPMCDNVRASTAYLRCMDLVVSPDAPFVSMVNVTSNRTDAAACSGDVLSVIGSSSGTSITSVLVMINSLPTSAPSSVFFATVASVRAAEQFLLGNATLFITTPVIASAVSSAATYLNVPFILLAFKPVASLVSGNREVFNEAAAALVPKYRGTLQYWLGSASYVIASVALDLSFTGVIGLITGPPREPSMTHHAFVRQSVIARCEACTLRSMFLSPILLTNLTYVLQLLTDASSLLSAVNGVDVVLLEVESAMLTQLQSSIDRMAAAGATLPVTLMCLSCVNARIGVSMVATPVVALATSALLSTGASSAVVDIALGAGQGLSISVCSACLTQRALRSYSDTTSFFLTDMETNGPSGMQDILTLPIASADPDFAEVHYTPSTSPSDALLAVLNQSSKSSQPISTYSSSTSSSTATLVAATASNCEWLQQAYDSSIHAQVECSVLMVTTKLLSYSVLNAGIGDWLVPQHTKVLWSSPVAAWVAAGNTLPSYGFSVDAILPQTFLVYGGESPTSLLPVPHSTMFRISVQQVGALEASPLVLSLESEWVAKTGSDGEPSPRSFHAHVSYYDATIRATTVYIHGGKTYGEALLRDLWSYNPSNGTWRRLPSSSSPRFKHAMVFLPQLDSTTTAILVVISGSEIFPLQTAESFVLQGSRSGWLASVTLDTIPSSCVAALPPSRVGFLSASDRTPCILDMTSMQSRCDTNESFASVDDTVYCATIFATPNMATVRGTAVVPATAVGSGMVTYFSNPCPGLKSRLQMNTSAGSSCPGSCRSNMFAYNSMCIPCDTTTIESYLSSMNQTVSSARLAAIMAVASSASRCGTSDGTSSSNGGNGGTSPASSTAVTADGPLISGSTLTVISTIVIAGVMTLSLVGTGALVWLTSHQELHADRDLRYAPHLIPVTFLCVDIHATATRWRLDPEAHANFLRVFHASLREAVAQGKAYRVRRVGDGILVACHDVVVAVNLVRWIRHVMRRALHAAIMGRSLRFFPRGHPINAGLGFGRRGQHSHAPGYFTGGGGGGADLDVTLNSIRFDSMAIQDPIALSISAMPPEGGAVPSVASSVPTAMELRAVESAADRLLSRLMFAIHTTSCVEVIRHDSSVDYRGADAMLPVMVCRSCLSGGEVAVSLDSVAFLEAWQRRTIASGTLLRRRGVSMATGGVPMQPVESLVQRVLAHVSESFSDTSLSSPSAALSLHANSSGGNPSEFPFDERIPTATGDRVRIVRAMVFDDAVVGASENHLDAGFLGGARISSALRQTARDETGGSCDNVVTPPTAAQVRTWSDDAKADDVAGREGGGAEKCPPTSTNANHSDAGHAAGGSAAGGGDPLLECLYDYLEEPEVQRGLVSRDEFRIMRNIVALLLRSAFASLEAAPHRWCRDHLCQAFDVHVFDRNLDPEGGPSSPYTQQSHALHAATATPSTLQGTMDDVMLLDRLAARVLQAQQPTTARQHLLKCAAAVATMYSGNNRYRQSVDSDLDAHW